MSETRDNERMTVGGIEIEVLRGGSAAGAAAARFPDHQPKAPFLSELAKHCSYFPPSLPGFGASKRPRISTRSTISSTTHLI
jgi:hypothetical protein